MSDETMEVAARYWEARLWSRYGQHARRSLEANGFDEQMVRSLRLGVAADEADDLARRLKSKGIVLAQLVQAGLVVREHGGGHRDRFRGHIVMPVVDGRGEVVDFLPLAVTLQRRATA